MSSPSSFLVRRAKSARLSPHLIWRKRETARSPLPFEPLLGRIEDGAPLDCKAGVFCNTNDDTINVLQPSGRLKPPEWGNSRMKGAGMLVGNFELNPQRRPIWAWPNLFLTPKRYHFKTRTNNKYSDFRILPSNTFTHTCLVPRLAVHNQSLLSRSPLPCEKRSAWGGGCTHTLF